MPYTRDAGAQLMITRSGSQSFGEARSVPSEFSSLDVTSRGWHPIGVILLNLVRQPTIPGRALETHGICPRRWTHSFHRSQQLPHAGHRGDVTGLEDTSHGQPGRIIVYTSSSHLNFTGDPDRVDGLPSIKG